MDAAGTYAWVVTPSTRPFVAKKGGSEAWTMTCQDAAGKVYESRDVTIARGQTLTEDFGCGGGPAPGPGPVPRPLARDRTPPRSTIRPGALRVSRSGVALAGTSVDTAPKGLTPRVAKVLVTIGRHVGRRRCSYLRADGTFGRPILCKVTPYVVAHVTATARRVGWSYSIGTAMPPGLYLAWARGIDASGNREHKQRTRNHVEFRIR